MRIYSPAQAAVHLRGDFFAGAVFIHDNNGLGAPLAPTLPFARLCSLLLRCSLFALFLTSGR